MGFSLVGKHAWYIYIYHEPILPFTFSTQSWPLAYLCGKLVGASIVYELDIYNDPQNDVQMWHGASNTNKEIRRMKSARCDRGFAPLLSQRA